MRDLMARPLAGTARVIGPQGRGNESLRIVVLGYVVRGPLGGMVWSNLQYVTGLARLGHDVFFVEDSDDFASCYDPVRDVMDTDPNYGLAFAGRAFERFGLDGRWAYWDAHTQRWLGTCADRILGICATADLVLDLCGVNPLRPWLMGIPARVLVDEDPAFTQIRHLTDPAMRARALRHTAFFAFGENIGRPGCAIPDDGLPWQPTRQPVVLDTLPVTPGPAHGKFTTIMLWDSYPSHTYDGVRYGMKSDSFMRYLDLPARAGRVFELAVGSATAPRSLLRRKGWAVRDSRRPTRDVETYHRYIQRSKAEWSVAKHGYVVSGSGWFSERSVAYMTCGRPVLIQDTGFSDWLPTGSGVIPFTTPEEALAGVEEIHARYAHHCRAARAIAEEYFDARKVLPRLIERAMSGPARPGAGGSAARSGGAPRAAATRAPTPPAQPVPGGEFGGGRRGPSDD